MSYIQCLYASTIIEELITLKNCPAEAAKIVSMNIFEHIINKEITSEQCLKYMKLITEITAKKCGNDIIQKIGKFLITLQ